MKRQEGTLNVHYYLKEWLIWKVTCCEIPSVWHVEEAKHKKISGGEGGKYG
jgi:hypothetical protein